MCLQGSGLPERLVIAEDLIGAVQAKLGCELSVLAAVKGAELEGSTYRHPLSSHGGELARESPVVVGGDYITTESGTGLVHTAPGHGIEDYQVGLSLLSCLVVLAAGSHHWDRGSFAPAEMS